MSAVPAAVRPTRTPPGPVSTSPTATKPGATSAPLYAGDDRELGGACQDESEPAVAEALGQGVHQAEWPDQPARGHRTIETSSQRLERHPCASRSLIQLKTQGWTQ